MDDEVQDEQELRVPKGTRLLHIYPDDLAELERILPEIFDLVISETAKGARMEDRGPELRTKYRTVQRIIRDVRWDYGPHEQIERIPC
jgi:hypothetical protein